MKQTLWKYFNHCNQPHLGQMKFFQLKNDCIEKSEIRDGVFEISVYLNRIVYFFMFEQNNPEILILTSIQKKNC